MKNILLSLMLFTICSVKAQNQNLTNGGFESWTDVNVYQLLDNWFTFNQYAVWGSSTTPVAKVTDAHSGNFAAKISSFVMFSGSGNPIDTIQGGILYGDFDIAGGGSPGVPFQSRPDSIVGYYKSSLLGGDTALVQVLLGNSPSTSSNQTGFCFGYITQNTSTYKRFSIPIIYDPTITIAPDTLILGIGIGSQNFNLASTITVDDIQFVYNVTGVDEIAQATFNVFPNPANNLLVIESTIEDNISIYNAVGQIVQTVQIIPAVKAEVNCSQLEEGIYFLKGKNGYSEKLVVKH